MAPAFPCVLAWSARRCAMRQQEIVEPLGATIDVDKFIVGDPTMSTLEIWGAEYSPPLASRAHSRHTALTVAFVGISGTKSRMRC
jgi:hypothetical protein